MKLVKIAAAVLNQTPLAWDQNARNITSAIAAARSDGASILVLPELCITGYGCEDAFHSPGLHEMAWRVLEEILPATQGMVVSVGLPISHSHALFNTACLIVDGKIVGFVGKKFLAGDGIHYEPRWFKPWPAGRRTEIVRGEQSYPLGDFFFDVGGIKIGFEICEDAWVAKRPGGDLSLRGIDVLLNPSASHFAFGKHEVRKRFVLEGSRAFGVTYVYTNLLGNEAGRAIYDGDALIASGGKLVAIGPRFSFADFRLTSATVDLDATRMARARTGSFTPDVGDEAHDCLRVDFTHPDREPQAPASLADPWEGSPHEKEEEFTHAVALSLFDYARKSHSKGFVVSLSGGADSAACACLVALMTEMGMSEIGREAFIAKLGMSKELAGATTTRDAVRRILTTVYQATENSSKTTREAARAVAEGIGSEHHELEVGPLVASYVDLVARALGRELTWQQDDVALQNVQARVRSPSVWLFANVKNALLLATSNRSEAAVGYTTMDGDTSGGLSPIGGIDKNFLRAWLRWLQVEGPRGCAPIPALEFVTVQAPTAELRPLATKQTDEEDLMPYDLLDAVERAAIRDKQTPLEVFRGMRAQFPQHSPRQLAVWVERFFRLWCARQWKRERYAPSFHLDDENLDPKTWCRFPILSGGFDRELAELRAHVARLTSGDGSG